MTIFSDDCLINSFTALCIVYGGAMALVPGVVAEKRGFEVKKETGSRLFLQGTGYIALCSALTLHLSSAGNFPVEAALGCGVLLRIFWKIKSVLGGMFSAAGVKLDKIGVVTAIESTCTYVLLSGKGDADVAAKIVVSVIGVPSALLFLSPVLVSSLVFGKDISKPGSKDSATARVVYKSFGEANVFNVSLMAALALGASPATALGCGNAVLALAELHNLATKHYLDLGLGISTGVIKFGIAAVTSLMLLA